MNNSWDVIGVAGAQSLKGLIKKNIEWALALYEYTDYVKVYDVRDGAFDDPGYFLAWINNGNYPHLASWINKLFPVPKPLKARAY